MVPLILSVYATIKIVEPASLKSLYPKGIYFQYSNIGFIPFGAELSGNLYKMEPFDACSSDLNSTANNSSSSEMFQNKIAFI